MNIKYNVNLLIQSGSSNCVQTVVSQLLTFFNITVSPAEIEKAIPVKYDKDNKPLGTLFTDVGIWLKTQGFETTLHVFDAQIIDRSWSGMSGDQLRNELKVLEEKGIATARSPYTTLLIKSYIDFLSQGGEINITYCTTDLLVSLLRDSPIIASVSYNYLHKYPRSHYDKSSKDYMPDFINGKIINHAVLITGYSDNQYTINDPDPENGGKKTIDRDVLIGAICATQLDSLNYVLTISGRK